jgi:predicted ATP-grasp superfamily ATP-dependent carboligase
MRVLITGASAFFSHPFIQGFGSRGIDVTAADSRWISVGKAARHTTRRIRLPVLSRDPAGYLQTLLDEVSSRSYDLVQPTFEESLLLGEYQHLFEPFTRLILPPFETMWQVHDKRSLYRLCQELRIPAPPTVMPRSPVGLEQQVAGLRFPVLLKLPAANNCVGRSYCDDIGELTERFNMQFEHERRRGAAPPFIQQKIDGDLIYTLMLCHEGRKLGEVIYRPLRTYPERGGTSAHRESIEHPVISSLTDRLALATGWSGFLGTDFIVDRNDGTAYLIDANPRPTPGIQLGRVAGIDWTGMLLNLIDGREFEPVSARPNVRVRSTLLDLGWLLEGCRPQWNWPARIYQRLSKYLKPDWSLDVRRDLRSQSEWGCVVALSYQAAIGLFKTVVTRRPLGQTILDDVNYDTVAAEALRESIAAQALLSPVGALHGSARPLRKSA